MTSTRPKNGKDTVVKVGATLSIYEVTALRDEIVSHLDTHGRLILDLGAIVKCDAAGIQLLYSARKTADKKGKSVMIRNPSSAVSRVVDDLGGNMDELLDRDN